MRLCEAEHGGGPPRRAFAGAPSILIALAVISLQLRGMLGCLSRRRRVDSFGDAAMILGGMGPYVAPKSEAGKLFEGFYALYSGLLLIGVTGLILAPVFHRVMHLCHLPDENGGSPKPTQRSSGAKHGR